MKRSLILLLLVSAVLTSCSEDFAPPTEPTVDKAAVWTRLPLSLDGTYLDKTTPVIGLQAGESDMVAMTPNNYVMVNPGGKVTAITPTQATAPTRTALPFLDPNYIVHGGLRQESSGNGPKYVVIHQRPSYGDFASPLQVHISELDATLSARAEYWDNPYNRKPLAVVNSAGQMLVRVFEQDLSLPNPKFLYMLQLSQTPGGVAANVVWRKEATGFLLTLNDRFFSSSPLGTDEIHPDGTVTKLFDYQARDMINYGSRMIASTALNGILASDDNGATWKRISSETEAFTLFEVDGKLCFLGHPSVLELREHDQHFDDGMLYETPLSRDGLPYGQFTAAVQYGYRVYIATAEGLFYKPVSHFFTTLKTD